MKQTVCVQGLGFVGAAMAIAVAHTCANKYDVVGVDLATPEGQARVQALQQGQFPFPTTDTTLQAALTQARQSQTLRATHDTAVFANADVILMCVPFDLSSVTEAKPTSNWAPLMAASNTLAACIPADCLVILQSTVLPGTLRQKLLPIFEHHFAQRGLHSPPQLAYSYERVMPGKHYLDSIINNHRCYSALTPTAADHCEQFWHDVINTQDYPLCKLAQVEAAETAKILENSFRAVNIALIEEWAQFTETLGVDLHDIVAAIRMRDTHKNLAQPGFGVGGYCLTKDPLFASQAAHELYDLPNMDFPFCQLAVKVNQAMPLRCLARLETTLGTLLDKKILLAGVSYKADVGDTRHSPASHFTQAARQRGAQLSFTDPLVSQFEGDAVATQIEQLALNQFDAIVFAVNHPQYHTQTLAQQLVALDQQTLIFDACKLVDSLALKPQLNNHNTYIIGHGQLA